MGIKLTKEIILNRIYKVHGSTTYDYSKFEYNGADTKSKIICPEHGEFWQTPSKHVGGQGCPTCRYKKSATSKKAFHNQQRRAPFILPTPRRSKAVPLTHGKYALVDEEDYERVMEYNWHLTKQGYAANSLVGKMHRFIMNPPDDMVVDHVNHNTIDNRKTNLKVCDRLHNQKNQKPQGNKSSRFKGVYWSNSKNRWVSEIISNFKKIYIGVFSDEIEAAKAYDEAAKKYHKDFAYLNFPYGVAVVYCSPCRYTGLIKE